MASSLFPIFLTNLLILLSHVIISSSAGLSRPNPLCHDKERSALLQFKESMDVSASSSPLAYSKLESWKHEVNDHQDNVSSCCLWDGVQCSDLTGHVIGLDLSSSYLSGFFSSNCSLFQLHYLVNLNLADNNFHNSRVPSSLANFSGLTHLNLSFSGFLGQIPPEISKLSKLSLLDISSNQGLILRNPDLGSLVQNLTSLEYLHLDEVKISSEMPMILANMSSLKSLVMSYCSLGGDFPKPVLQLPNLETLVLSNNPNLQGNLPDFNSSSPLQCLDISETSFSGKLPASIGSVTSLQKIDIDECGFSGQVPASLRNLRHLVYLSLSDNYFVVENSYSLAWIGELTKLSYLDLSNIHLGEVPAYLANLTHLAELYLESCGIVGQIPSLILKLKHLRILDFSSNELEGPIPEWITQVTQLRKFYAGGNKLQGQIPSSIHKLIHLIEIDLPVNKLHGPIPGSIFQLKNLEVLDLYSNKLSGPIPELIFQLKNLELLDLASNKLSGPVDLDMFLKLKELTQLMLSGNKLSLISKSNNTAIALQKFDVLVLGSCNLQRFPNFLRDQDELHWLDLSNNHIHGLIPKWIWSISKYTLEGLSLEGNLLTGLEHNPISFPWIQVGSIDLSYNRLEGSSLPLPPSSTEKYDVSRNNFSGEIALSFCSYKSLKVLDLSHNNLSGMLPSCLGNIVTSTQVLNLAGNKLRGQIFHIQRKDCKLKQLKLNQNQLEGKLPRSLTQCAQLHFLDIGNNRISGTFPYWLGSLQELRVLSLRSNNLTGVLQSQRSRPQFRKLRIIDISVNNFSGQLPTQYFLDWKAMKEDDTEEGTYMGDYENYNFGSVTESSSSDYTISITNKGIQLDYSKIPESFVVIHFSDNRFEGGIPEVLGDLKGLHLLNLSNNNLNGSIPRSIGNLRNLESLDLSRNNLSGEIPQQLAQLNFLEVFNVSYNHLEGPIPKGKQFETFQNDSYLGNMGLCGTLLTRKCDLSSPGDGGSGSWFEFGWEPVVIGYGCGVPLGVLIVFIVDIMKHGWIVKTFRIKQSRNTRRGRTQRRRNRFA